MTRFRFVHRQSASTCGGNLYKTHLIKRGWFSWYWATYWEFEYIGDTRHVDSGICWGRTKADRLAYEAARRHAHHDGLTVQV